MCLHLQNISVHSCSHMLKQYWYVMIQNFENEHANHSREYEQSNRPCINIMELFRSSIKTETLRGTERATKMGLHNMQEKAKLSDSCVILTLHTAHLND